MLKKDKKKVWHYCIILFLLFTLVVVGLYYLKPIVQSVNQYGVLETLRSYEENAKYIYFSICFLQPIILPLPEPVTIMAGSAAFGSFNGAMIGFLGTLLGIIFMFMFSKFASKKVINKVFDKEKLDKFNSYIKKHETLVILALFIIPILPDEIICAGSGLVKINVWKFISIAILSKLITTFSLSYSLQVIDINMNTILLAVMCLLAIGILKVLKVKRNQSLSRGVHE